MKTLVVYYSRKGYVQEAAMQKVRQENADFLELETIENTAGWYGFANCAKFAVTGKAMTLFPYETDVSAYDKVIICTPVWMGRICSPMAEFMKKEKHNITKAEYVFFHFLPADTNKIADEADRMLRLKRDKVTSVQCMTGKIIKEEEF